MLLGTTRGHPYGTQELAYFVWELVPTGGEASMGKVEEALTRVIRSEHNHLAQLWDDAPRPQRLLVIALAEEPARSIYSADYHSRHELPATPTLQTALAGLIKKEIVGRNDDGEYCVIEPFFAEWVQREQRDRRELWGAEASRPHTRSRSRRATRGRRPTDEDD